ncbi:MAG: hypothetical protein ACREDR_21685 [Blastocatellia bacterium]
MLGMLLLGPGVFPAFQTEGGGADHQIWRVINLAVFILILAYIFRNKLKIGQFFENRASGIARELEQSKKEKQEADAKLLEIDARMARLDQEVAEMRAEAEIEARREAERVRQEALADAEKIQQLAHREIEGAMIAARAELRAFVADNSVARAESIIRRNITPDDEKRLLGEYAGELIEVNK